LIQQQLQLQQAKKGPKTGLTSQLARVALGLGLQLQLGMGLQQVAAKML